MKKSAFLSKLLLFTAILSIVSFGKTNAQKIKWNKVKILVYTKNGKGYIHDNIANSVVAIQELGKQNGFTVDVSEDPGKFTDDNLKQYDALVFSNTNNDVFDTDAQRVALMRYIQAGGSFVGLHSACGTERSWRWFKDLLGGTFFWHEPGQSFSVNVLDTKNPSLAHLPQKWDRAKDEFYFLKEMSVNLNVLAVNDHTTIQKPAGKALDTFGTVFPSVWWHEYDGGRAFYTSIGHEKEDYLKDDLRKHILGGIEWVIGPQKPRNYSKAYATSPTDMVRKK
ncbi:ThuA domain-containing protein [Dyadobacter psychrotolerans]|uniref:ThuA domain-containing protein n=1 Tax=Dyadobacter psychrotolerans TaxID=2541721 RepID=A0A4R5DET1_9BACT|nr:ThuA domain-containing protein [Dyadobacter psychrotolerans]TDE11647.1 ThuA domain-containing protein [Dyadobacter psychrotolerans]